MKSLIKIFSLASFIIFCENMTAFAFHIPARRRGVPKVDWTLPYRTPLPEWIKTIVILGALILVGVLLSLVIIELGGYTRGGRKGN